MTQQIFKDIRRAFREEGPLLTEMFIAIGVGGVVVAAPIAAVGIAAGVTGIADIAAFAAIGLLTEGMLGYGLLCEARERWKREDANGDAARPAHAAGAKPPGYTHG